MQPLPWEIGSLKCRFRCICHQKGHYCGSQLKGGILQQPECSVSPVQSFVAETCLILIMHLSWSQKQTFHSWYQRGGVCVLTWELHMLVGGAMSLRIYNRVEDSMKSTALAVGVWSRPTEWGTREVSACSCKIKRVHKQKRSGEWQVIRLKGIGGQAILPWRFRH